MNEFNLVAKLILANMNCNRRIFFRLIILKN